MINHLNNHRIPFNEEISLKFELEKYIKCVNENFMKMDINKNTSKLIIYAKSASY